MDLALLLGLTGLVVIALGLGMLVVVLRAPSARPRVADTSSAPAGRSVRTTPPEPEPEPPAPVEPKLSTDAALPPEEDEFDAISTGVLNAADFADIESLIAAADKMVDKEE